MTKLNYPVLVCGRCGQHNSIDFAYCPKCSAKLPVVPERRPRPQRKIRGRTAAFLLLTVAASIYFSYSGSYEGWLLDARLPSPINLADRPPVVVGNQLDANDQLTTPGGQDTIPREPRTLLPSDQRWTDNGAWLVYQSTWAEACIAEKVFPDGTIFLLGVTENADELLIGLAAKVVGSGANGAATILTLSFDNRRHWQPYFEGIRLGHQPMVAGRFRDGGKLRKEIAASSILHIQWEQREVTALSLDGTRAALVELDECKHASVESKSSVEKDASSALALPLCVNRPANGELLKRNPKRKPGGHKVTARNGTSGDALINLRDSHSRELVLSFFVHRGSTATVSGIADGEYVMQLAYGTALNSNCTDYVDPVASQFDQNIRLSTKTEKSKKGTATTTQIYSVTLYDVINGNVTKHSISAREFTRN